MTFPEKLRSVEDIGLPLDASGLSSAGVSVVFSSGIRLRFGTEYLSQSRLDGCAHLFHISF